MRILGVCGSLQTKSSNQTLLEVAASLAPTLAPHHPRLDIFDGIAQLPLFNPDLDSEAETSVSSWREELNASDALLIACPEYGHSLPGALKNAIDWVIGSGELYQKVVAITASVPEPRRGRRGLDALATSLRAVDAQVIGGVGITRGKEFEQQLSQLLASLSSIAAGPSVQQMPAPIERLDHLVLTVRDIDRTLQFYTTHLHMTAVSFAGGRKALNFGRQKLNLHQVGQEFEPKADAPTPGSADLCFITQEPVTQAAARLTSEGVPVLDGPIERTGARGPILSIYLRDPDNNLIELSNEV